MKALKLLGCALCLTFYSIGSAVIIPDFQVNPQDTAFIAQYTTDIAFQPNGNFVVVWEDRGWDHRNRQIYFQIYDSLGNRITSPVSVSDTNTGHFNQECGIATDSGGNFAICYSSAKYMGYDSIREEGIYIWDIWVRLYSADGLPLTSSIKVDVDRPDPLHNPEAHLEIGPSICRHKSGKLVIAWAEEIFYSDTIVFPFTRRIFSQFFDLDGNRVGNNVWVSSLDSVPRGINNDFATVGITENGYVMVCWEGIFQKSNGRYYNFPVGSIFSIDGVNLRGTFPIISPEDPEWSAGGFPDLDASPKNDFIVTCYSGDSLNTYPNNTIVVLRLDTLGNPLNRPQIVVDTVDIGDLFTMPKVAAGLEGYVVIWSDQRTRLRDLMVQRFDYNNNLIGRNYRINSIPGSLTFRSDTIPYGRQDNWLWYNLDISNQGKMVAAWSDFRNYLTSQADIFAKLLEVSDVGFYVAGDLNQNGEVDLSDLIFLVNYVFKGGTQPTPLFTADVNADCKVNLTDIIYLVNYVFKAGNSPKQGCAY